MQVIFVNYIKSGVLLLLLISVLNLAGCCKRQIMTKADELMSASWSAQDGYGKKITLSFTQNEALIQLEAKDFTGKICGTATVIVDTLEIADKSLKENYIFGYVLFGNKIDLKYGDKTVTLRKINK